MKNLAGNPNCDSDIRTELEKAGITIVVHPVQLRNEVPATLTGKLTRSGLETFNFTRAWYYWMVQGKVPLAVAQELYQDPNGRKDVRARGDDGCPSPEEVVAWFAPDGRMLTSLNEKSSADRLVESGSITREKIDSDFIFADPADFPNLGLACVPNYHIDTQEGLNFFVATLRKHGLVD